MIVTRGKRLFRLSPFRIIILGFAGLILLGTLLLMLPFATRGEGSASFLDALFTATSSVCVTGLIVQDTATYWSSFGHGVIIVLIQIGGMGVITVAALFSMLIGKKIGLSQRNLMQEAISAPQVGGIVRLTRFAIKGTLLMELAGAIALMPPFIKEFGLKGIWYAFFHAISAFCNAGFDLMGVKEKFSSLTGYSADAYINTVIMLLIVIGGIGFITWDDIIKHKWHFNKYRMQSKVALVVSLVLIAVPAIYFFFFEYAALGMKERTITSLFQSVTSRTAGFNTADLSAMSQSGQGIMILLMLIGGSPGSTAGGMKTTTVAVLVSLAVSVFFHKQDAHLFKKRIPENSLRNAATILTLYLILFFISGIVISSIEDLPLLTALYETASAVGTVGITLGVTPTLCATSKCILMVLMFFGRVGGLTMIFAAISGKGSVSLKLPEEKITVG